MITNIFKKNYFSIFKYFTNWSFVLFLLWYFNKKSRKYIHIELLVNVIFYGYLAIYIFYHLLYKNREYNLLFLSLNILFHYIPYKIISERSVINQKSILFFIIIFILYMIFLLYHSKTPFDVYFNDKEK